MGNLGKIALLVVGVVATIAVWVLAIQNVNSTPTGSTSTYTPVPGEKEPPSALFIGDSYTAGAGAKDPETERWSAVAAEELGWVEVNNGVGGSGYVTTVTGDAASAACGAETCPRYVERIPSLSSRYTPDLVVLAGGRNDTGQQGVGAAVTETVEAAREAFPGARVVVVSPVWDEDEPPAEYAEVRAEVVAAAREAGVRVVDVGEPLAGRAELVTGDDVHPTTEGHEVLARAFVRAWHR